MKPSFRLQLSVAVMATALLFSSCKKDSSATDPTPGPEPVPAASKLKKVSKDDEVIEFTYATDRSVKPIKVNNKLTTGGSTTTFNITYGADQKIAVLTAADGSQVIPHYNGNLLTSAESLDAAGNILFNTSYLYQSGNLWSALVEILLGVALKFTYTTNNGNVSRIEVSGYNPHTGRFELGDYTDYQYDAKANPMHEFKDLLYLFLLNNPGTTS